MGLIRGDTSLGYSTTCAICNHADRASIEKRVKEEGLSYRGVVRLLGEQGISISTPSVSKHFREHIDVRAAAREQYEESQKSLAEMADKRVSDISMLDKIATENYRVNQELISMVMNAIKKAGKDVSDVQIPRSVVQLIQASSSEVRQNLKQKYELLGEGPEEGGNLADILVAVWEEINGGQLPPNCSQSESSE